MDTSKADQAVCQGDSNHLRWVSAGTMSTLRVDLVNNTGCHPAYAYVTGLDINRNYTWIFLKSDGYSLFRPSSPPAPLHPLLQDCAIPLGPPGSTTTLYIPQLAGARIWFSLLKRLTFSLNPGPAIVMPSVTNPTDPNIDIQWAFAEFTYNSSQVFANISHVDFFSIPISMTLHSTSGKSHHITGTGPDGLESVTDDIMAQHDRDGAGWNKLVYYDQRGNPIRVLSPNCGMQLHPGLFAEYFSPLIDEAWDRFAHTDVVVDTQAASGVVRGRVMGDRLCFPHCAFSKPTSTDVFNNSTGPFRTDGVNDEARAIIPRLAAAFNRGTVLGPGAHPIHYSEQDYYRHGITNHYARILHRRNLDGKGYAFPYDDVCAREEENVAGVAYDDEPERLVFTLGGERRA